MISSKSYYSIEYYGSLVDPRNLICEIYRGEITLKIFSSKITCYMSYKQYIVALPFKGISNSHIRYSNCFMHMHISCS